MLWKQRESGGIVALVVGTGSRNPIIDPTLTPHLHLARCGTRIRRKEGKKQAIVLSKYLRVSWCVPPASSLLALVPQALWSARLLFARKVGDDGA